MVVRGETAVLTERRRARVRRAEAFAPAEATRRDEATLARGLGWFSIGLGLTELLAPTFLARLIGVKTDQPLLVRACGLRELAAGLGIFARRRPAGALWSRVVGDVIDLSLLGRALDDPRNDRARLLGAVAAVMGVTALDVASATSETRLARRGRTVRVVRSLAINRSPADCYALWRRLDELPRFMHRLESVRVLDDRRSHWVARGPAGTIAEWDAELVRDVPGSLLVWRSLDGGDVEARGSVRFTPRPGDRGTIVRVAMESAPPAGKLGAFVARLFAVAPEQQVKEDLRRFKQLLETGEIPTTEGQPSCRRSAAYRAFTRLGGEA